MKKQLISIIIIFSTLSLFSQRNRGPFDVNKFEIESFLDSIAKQYDSHRYQRGFTSLDFSNYLDYGNYAYAYSEDPKLFGTPEIEGAYKERLQFGDTILFPMFMSLKQPVPLTFIYGGETDWYYVNFCITKKGNYGFISSDSYIDVHYIKPIPNTDYLLFRWSPQAIVYKNDYTKRKYLNTSEIVFFSDNNLLVYCIDLRNDKDYMNMYTFQIDTWTEKYIGKGFSPKFIDTGVVYWSKEEEGKKTEKVHFYNLNTKTDEVIFVAPDSLTLWSCGPDECDSHNIKIKEGNNESYIYLEFCSTIVRPGEDECGQPTNILINRKGEIIKIE